MTKKTRLEINIERLLRRCELIAKDDPYKDWKLGKYIHSLITMMKKLESLPSKPLEDTMIEYYIRIYAKRIEFVTEVLDVMKLSNLEERRVATEWLLMNPLFTNNSSTKITTRIHHTVAKFRAKYNRKLRAELKKELKEHTDSEWSWVWFITSCVLLAFLSEYPARQLHKRSPERCGGDFFIYRLTRIFNFRAMSRSCKNVGS
ncbi:PREDICTED: vesicle transport protein USE1-like [Vollenhovia emeryi]|uniref:vesicle transport protein USE1-like n=1 Tax=Vollenhovia emeryi TaxID=411798 RepID=UPI0005F443A6|nr:PREDICTED: vesicle transport protein USE1-like [Vollenhovia emeryi]XP_011858278.1 PREDICTED: vesicle transport protein USE1-like [Vollenhovia emeryi]